MSLTDQLNSLLSRNAIAVHPVDVNEIAIHVQKANKYLKDFEAKGLSNDSKFGIAYNAGHQMLMGGIKMEGYKPVNQAGHRAILYDLIKDMFPGAANSQEPMARAHMRRNKDEYDGEASDVTDAQVSDLHKAIKSVNEEINISFKQFKKKLDAQKKETEVLKLDSSPALPVPLAMPITPSSKKSPFKKR